MWYLSTHSLTRSLTRVPTYPVQAVRTFTWSFKPEAAKSQLQRSTYGPRQRQRRSSYGPSGLQSSSLGRLGPALQLWRLVPAPPKTPVSPRFGSCRLLVYSSSSSGETSALGFVKISFGEKLPALHRKIARDQVKRALCSQQPKRPRTAAEAHLLAHGCPLGPRGSPSPAGRRSEAAVPL